MGTIPAGSFKPPPWWVANSRPSADGVGIAWPPVIGEAKHYAAALEVIRERIIALEYNYEDVDAKAGIPLRYTGNCMCVPPRKFYSGLSLFSILGALGLVAVFVVDPEFDPTKISKRQIRLQKQYMRGQARMRQVDVEFMRRAARKGANKTNAKLTPAQRSRNARKAAKALWAGRAAGTLPKAKRRAATPRRRPRSSALGAVQSPIAPRCASMPA